MNILKLAVLIFFFTTNQSRSQNDTIYLELEGVLEMALKQSPTLKLAHSELLENTYETEHFNAKLKPNLSLSAITPNLSRSIEARPLPDGRDAFVSRATMYNSLALELMHQIPSINASLYARSNLERLDVFKTNQFDATKTYFFTPISLGINIPIFGFNSLKWERERLNLVSEELQARQAVIREEVITDVLGKFATCLQLQQSLELQLSQIVDTDSLFKIKERLHQLGRVSKAEILRLNLQQQNNISLKNQLGVDLERAKKELFDLIKYEPNEPTKLVNPQNWQPILLDEARAFNEATQNHYIRARHLLIIRQLESEQNKVKKENGLALNINASIGLNKTDDDLQDIFENLLDREVLSASISVPITGAKGRRKREEIISEQLYREKLKMKEEIIDLGREVKVLIKEYKLLVENIQRKKEATRIAKEIYEINRRQFLSGNISISELNISNNENNQALMDYYQAIISSIQKYYAIRKICLFDFEKNNTLVIKY